MRRCRCSMGGVTSSSESDLTHPPSPSMKSIHSLGTFTFIPVFPLKGGGRGTSRVTDINKRVRTWRNIRILIGSIATLPVTGRPKAPKPFRNLMGQTIRRSWGQKAKVAAQNHPPHPQQRLEKTPEITEFILELIRESMIKNPRILNSKIIENR